MKMDIDSIFYIILSIIILVVSGLGSRRRKQAQQMKQTAQSPAQAYGEEQEESGTSQTRRPGGDPFERLEQFLTGQPAYETLGGDSLEVVQDEEEAILKEQEEATVTDNREMDKMKYDLPEEKRGKDEGINLEGLFGDIDEITKAVIYSEIFPRRFR